MNLDEAIEEALDECGMARSEEATEVGRMVATLQS